MTSAIASGKGGTGKTTVALNVTSLVDSPVWLLDCDVEEPNWRLLIKSGLCADVFRTTRWLSSMSHPGPPVRWSRQ
ncbi:MAG: hypothetical protein ABIK62_07405 [candidate division WOR-3 bacterium]